MKEKIENIVYILILTPLAIVAITISYQLLLFPDKIPNIFGYKMFVVFEEYMDDSLEYGDLAITYNSPSNSLVEGDVIAFRNGQNTVTIHKIEDIRELYGEDSKTYKMFTMKTLDNEDVNAKYVDENKLEGQLVYKIPKLGAFLYFIQKPIPMLIISFVILAIGSFWIYIANKLDEEDEELNETSE